MSIWNKILIGFIFVAAAAFFYMGARTLKMREHWCELAQAFDAKIVAIEKENVLLAGEEQQAEEAEMDIRKATVELHEVLVDRGRMWTNCDPQRVDKKTGAVTVTTDRPDPHQIGEKTSLVVFAENDIQDGGSYLGKFTVTKVNERQVEMVPTRKMTQQTLDRLAKSTGSWTLYDIMPIDNHDIFAGLGEDDLITLLPKTTSGEYVEDGGKARKLRNYGVLFREYHRHLSMMTDMFEAATRDKKYIDSAVVGVKQQVVFRQDEIDQLKQNLTERTREFKVVANHEEALETKTGLVNNEVGTLIKKNTAMANQIALIQKEATRRIDARTRSVARLNAVDAQ